MGMFTEKASLVAAAFTNFANAFNSAVAKKRAASLHSDNTLKVGGKADTDFAAETTTAIAAHISNGDHFVTPAQVGAYSATEMVALNNTYHEVSAIPFVSFGDPTKTPVDVSGAFSGGTDGAVLDYGMNLEDDGTLVILRNGTDGSKLRAYYAYLPNAANGSFSKLVRSTKEFRPSNMPSDKAIAYILGSNNVMITARMCGINDSVFGDYALFLPGGSYLTDTMPMALVASANMPAGWYRDAVIVGGYVYFFHLPLTSGTMPLNIAVYRIPLTSFNGGYVVPEKITGWTVNTLRRSNVASTDINLFEALYSYDSNVDSLIYVDNSKSNGINAVNVFHNPPTFLVAQKDDRYIRIRSLSYTYLANTAAGQATGHFTVFSFVIDLLTKTVTMDPAGNGRETLYLGYYSDGRYNVSSEGFLKYNKAHVLGDMLGNTNHDVGILQKPGYIFSITCNVEADSARIVQRSKIVGASDDSFFEGIKYGTTLTREATLTFNPVYGSALGSKFYGILPFSDNGFFAGTYGRNKAGGTIQYIARIINDASQPNYQHKRLSGAALPGYGPSTNRTFLSDEVSTADANMYSSLVCEVDDVDGYLVHGSYFVDEVNNSGFGEIDSTGREKTPGARVSINRAIYNQAWAAIVAKFPTEAGNPQARSFGAFFPKRLPRAYGYALWRSATNGYVYFVMFEFKVTGGTLETAVTAIEIQSISNTVALAGSGGTGVSVWSQFLAGGISIYKVGTEGYAVGFTTKSFYSFVGGAGSIVARFFVDIFSDKEPQVGDWTTLSTTSVYPHLANNFGYTALKGYGFGQYNSADNYTKAVFYPVVKTKAGFKAMTKTGNNQVLATQELAQGWDVYFTNANRVLMAGKVFDIPATSFNLKTIDASPQNKTFYVYLKYSGGTVSYEILANRAAENYAYVQIGTIVTGANSIASINISKIALTGSIIKDNT